LTHDPDSQPRTWKRLTRNDFLRQTQLTPHRSHFVFEQQPQRLDQFELQIAGQATHIVMAFDVRGAAAPAGLHHVGIKRPLYQELDIPARSVVAQDVPYRALKGPDELPADDLTLALGRR